ncbi:MAG: hypothetical protein N3A02_00320, partial [Rectinema sp.]|nr:hypothetical protein [Rectinema sp.]
IRDSICVVCDPIVRNPDFYYPFLDKAAHECRVPLWKVVSHPAMNHALSLRIRDGTCPPHSLWGLSLNMASGFLRNMLASVKRPHGDLNEYTHVLRWMIGQYLLNKNCFELREQLLRQLYALVADREHLPSLPAPLLDELVRFSQALLTEHRAQPELHQKLREEFWMPLCPLLMAYLPTAESEEVARLFHQFVEQYFRTWISHREGAMICVPEAVECMQWMIEHAQHPGASDAQRIDTALAGCAMYAAFGTKRQRVRTGVIQQHALSEFEEESARKLRGLLEAFYRLALPQCPHALLLCEYHHGLWMTTDPSEEDFPYSCGDLGLASCLTNELPPVSGTPKRPLKLLEVLARERAGERHRAALIRACTEEALRAALITLTLTEPQWGPTAGQALAFLNKCQINGCSVSSGASSGSRAP